LALLPLFPLDVVLLPGSVLPLHIFEARYKEMIGECVANKSHFGVVRAVEQGIAEIGCTAEITEITKRYSDGRLDLISEGRERFQVVELDRGRPFLRGEVLILPDGPDSSLAEEKKRAMELHDEILSLAGADQDFVANDERTLSYQLAGSLPLELDFKQKLLGISSERERMHELAMHLDGIIAGLRRVARIRAKAGGNGHAR
jgi:Lon protease-like protein